MAKFPKPFYRKSRDCWYVQIGTKQHSLGRGSKEEIQKRYHQTMAKNYKARQVELSEGSYVKEIFDGFRSWALQKRSPATAAWYHHFNSSFAKHIGADGVAHGDRWCTELRQHHVTQWIDANPSWGQSGQRAAISAIKRAFQWAVDEQYIDASPIAKVERPEAKARTLVLSPTARKAVVKKVSGKKRLEAFVEFVTVLDQTGARPHEVRTVEARHVDLKAGTWTFPPEEHKTGKKTRMPRVVYLTKEVISICRKRMKERPEGPLFLNSRKKPWTRNAIRCNFRRIRGDQPLFAYAYRHTFATDALKRGVHPEELRQLLGHESLDMISKVYGHLDQDVSHMRKAAGKVR